MPFTDEQIINISSILEENQHIFEHLSSENDIIIKDGIISFIHNNNVKKSKKIDVHALKQNILNIPYGKNVFINSKSVLNPLEADRKNNKYIWEDDYNHIDFPKFMPIVLLSVLNYETIPSPLDLCNIYRLTYIESIPPDKASTYETRLKKYNETTSKIKDDHVHLGKIIYFENQPIENILIRFKEKYNPESFKLPFNEFSVDHLYGRIYKAYPSLIRDVFNAFYFDLFNVDVFYSLYNDLCGVDLFINDIPIFVFTKTSSAKEFSVKKITTRHSDLKDKLEGKFGVKLIKGFHGKKSNGIHLITDDSINEVIDIIKKKPDNEPLDKFYNIEF